MIEAVIFDVDGLLIDSEPLWREAEIEIFREVGVSLSHDLCLQTTGLRIDEVVRYWHQRFPWEGPSLEEVAAKITSRVIQLIRQVGEPREGALHAVHFARSKEVKVALASSSVYALIHTVVEKLGIQGQLDLIHSAEDEEYGKPHPGVYLSTAKKLLVEPTRCLAVEDSLTGVLAAKAARMKCIAVPEEAAKSNPRFVIADKTLSSLRELDDALWQELSSL